MTDGTVRDFTDTTKTYVQFDTLGGDYYLVVRHRNHIPIMTAVPHPLNGATSQTYDFTNGISQAYGVDAMNALTGGVFGMVAGDVNGSGVINAADRGVAWNERGLEGYVASDVNLNGVSNAADRGIVWNNRGIETQVP